MCNSIALVKRIVHCDDIINTNKNSKDRNTGPLWGEFSGDRRISHTKGR